MATGSRKKHSVGVFRYRIALRYAEGDQFEEVEPWVDTGAVYSQFPGTLLRRLGYQPNATRKFRLADGSTAENGLGAVFMRVGDEVQPVPCVFAEEGSDPLLGATALEIFSLVPDTTNHTLRPMISMRLTRLELDGAQQLTSTMMPRTEEMK